MHSIEGLFAATIIFFYAIQLFQSMSVHRVDWVEASSKQEMQEFLMAAKNSDMAELAFHGDASNFLSVTRHFLGESRGYSMKITNLPKHIFEVGVLTENMVSVEATLNASPCLVPTEHSCYESTFQGIDYVLADYGFGASSGIEKYDVLYFDLDSSGTYTSSEGPFIEDSVISIGGTYWSIGEIHNNSGNVSFWGAEQLSKIKQHVGDFEINGRQTHISARGITFSENLLLFDALIIPAELNDITPYESEIYDYLGQGGGVVRLKNITDPANISNAEKNILAISWVDYDIEGSGSGGIITRVSAKERIYLAGKYFLFSGISINTVSTNITGYFVENITNNDAAYTGRTTLGKQEYALFVTKAAASPTYNLLRIDVDQDFNFTNEVELAVGDSIIIDSNNYTVKYIIDTGRGITLRPNSGHEFRDVIEPQGKVYPESGLEKNVFMESKTKRYNITTRSIGSSVTTPVVACTTGESTMPPGEHLCGIFNAGIDYNFSITNTSIEYDKINIDFNNNGEYNNENEGPYGNGAYIAFGPEIYQAAITLDGSDVTWPLYERRHIPYGTVNYIGDGTAIWMPDNQVSDDEWSLFKAALVASGKDYFELATGAAHGMRVVSSSVFFDNKETYMPYDITIKMWY